MISSVILARGGGASLTVYSNVDKLQTFLNLTSRTKLHGARGGHVVAVRVDSQVGERREGGGVNHRSGKLKAMFESVLGHDMGGPVVLMLKKW